jgi:hypothetical protein
MKKAKSSIATAPEPEHLFRPAIVRRHRNLVLPRLLEEEANKPINLNDCA